MHRKIAGVPVWGWLLAAAGAVALGIYFRRRAVASNTDGGTSAQSTFGGMTDALAGGTPAPAPSGLDPALADLLTNAQSILGDQAASFAQAAGGSAANAFGDVFGDTSGVGFDTPASVNVSSSSGSGAANTGTVPTYTQTASGPIAPQVSAEALAASVGGARPAYGPLAVAKPAAPGSRSRPVIRAARKKVVHR